MNKREYGKLEGYMLECMKDSAHDKDHIYRVLYAALDIAHTESGIDRDVLVAACLLHDIGRKAQFENPGKNHAKVGSKMAYDFLCQSGWSVEKAQHAADCIASHRFRGKKTPQSLEAKILFDADKLDVTGTLGIARTLFYAGQESEPLYSLLADGSISDGSSDEAPSFFQEYKFKLEKLYGVFYTERAKSIACGRQAAAVSFYDSMWKEAQELYVKGLSLLSDELE